MYSSTVPFLRFFHRDPTRWFFNEFVRQSRDYFTAYSPDMVAHFCPEDVKMYRILQFRLKGTEERVIYAFLLSWIYGRQGLASKLPFLSSFLCFLIVVPSFPVEQPSPLRRIRSRAPRETRCLIGEFYSFRSAGFLQGSRSRGYVPQPSSGGDVLAKYRIKVGRYSFPFAETSPVFLGIPPRWLKKAYWRRSSQPNVSSFQGSSNW